MLRITFLIALLYIAVPDLNGQSERIARIDSLLTEMTDHDLFSGAVLIAEDCQVSLCKGYGYSNREKKTVNTPDTRFDLSSGSKIFTGTAITYLAQQGKIKFSDTIGKYINGLPKGNIITIHQILTHSSGFDDFYKAAGFSYKDVKNCTDIMPYMRKLPLIFNPGDSCVYSTGNAIILGAVIEKISGMTYQGFIEKTFIKPYDLQNTCFTPYWKLNASQSQFAVGYYKDEKNGYKPNAYDYDYGFIPLSAGGAWSSIIDLYKFDQAVFTGKILNDEYLKLMTSEYTTPIWKNCHFGYIWIIDDSHTRCIGHAGNSSGWNTWNYYYPAQKTVVIILTNFGSVDVFELAAMIDKLLFGEN
jgi:CubicO group peptidase (beta-lactamase class C family)